MKIIFTILVFISLVGCTELADTASKMGGLGVISENKSLFDGARVLEVSPAWLYNPDKNSGNSVKLGARWDSSKPEIINLIMSYQANTLSLGRPVYVGLKGLELNIDGKVSSFNATAPTQTENSGYNTISRTIYTDSRNNVEIPVSLFNQMLDGKKVLIRIITSSGYEDSNFSIERFSGGQGTSILSLREFRDRLKTFR